MVLVPVCRYAYIFVSTLQRTPHIHLFGITVLQLSGSHNGLKTTELSHLLHDVAAQIFLYRYCTVL
jgi:hypothetical protein